MQYKMMLSIAFNATSPKYSIHSRLPRVLRLERRLDVLGLERVPVQRLEKDMRLDVLHPIHPAA